MEAGRNEGGNTVYSKIQQMKQAELTQRRAARQLGINRKTVKRYWNMPVDDYEAMSPRICRAQSLGQYEGQIVSWLRLYSLFRSVLLLPYFPNLSSK